MQISLYSSVLSTSVRPDLIWIKLKFFKYVLVYGTSWFNTKLFEFENWSTPGTKSGVFRYIKIHNWMVLLQSYVMVCYTWGLIWWEVRSIKKFLKNSLFFGNIRKISLKDRRDRMQSPSFVTQNLAESRSDENQILMSNYVTLDCL